MAKIITVHGTFSGGEASGSQWWQKGSGFEATLRDLVEAADGQLDFVPHHWDGLNSEVSRQRAGTSLAERLRELEKRKENYCLIGHSHGGSVILSALTQCIYRRQSLAGLSRWVTVGTPFIQFARKRLLFSRLGLFGKAAWVSVVTYFALFMLGMLVYHFKENANSLSQFLGTEVFLATIFLILNLLVGWSIDRRLARAGRNLSQRFKGGNVMRLLTSLYTIGSVIVLVGWAANKMEHPTATAETTTQLIVMICVLASPLLFRWLLRRIPWIRRFIERRRDAIRKLHAITQTRWLSFRHPLDEAVEGLQRVSGVSFSIFDKNFVTAPLTFLSVMVLPVLMIAIASSPAASTWVANAIVPHDFNRPTLFADGVLKGGGHDFAINMSTLLILPVAALTSVLRPFIAPPNDGLVAVLIFPVLLLAGAIFVVGVTRVLVGLVSRVLSALLNRSAWSQIRASAYGDDTQGELAMTSAGAPTSLQPQPALPEALAAEISAVADGAAAATVAKFRSSLNRLAFAGDTRAERDLISEYLTWDELIHTTYFKVELFNKYVAYVVANSEGFKPTDRFLADPDYLRLAAWYADYHVREQNAAMADAHPPA